MKGSQTDAQTQASSRKARRMERQIPRRGGGEGRGQLFPEPLQEGRASFSPPASPAKPHGAPPALKLDRSSVRTTGCPGSSSQEHTRVLLDSITTGGPRQVTAGPAVLCLISAVQAFPELQGGPFCSHNTLSFPHGPSLQLLRPQGRCHHTPCQKRELCPRKTTSPYSQVPGTRLPDS